jgi:hypothetical protein
MKKNPDSGNKGFTTAKLIVALTVLFLLSLLLTIYFIKNPLTGDSEGKIQIELIKSLLTVLSVAIIGGVIAALFKSYERNQEQLKLRLQAKTSFMARLGALYRTVKRSRRKMNANGIEASDSQLSMSLNKTQITLYKDEMTVINDVQLELEGFKTDVENGILFLYDENIIASLKRMESYLRKIVKEFERNFQNSANEEHVNLDNFPYLKEFTYAEADNKLLAGRLKMETQPDYCFKTNFSGGYYNVLSNF